MSEHKMAPVKSIHWNNDKKEACNYWPVHSGQPNMKHGYHPNSIKGAQLCFQVTLLY